MTHDGVRHTNGWPLECNVVLSCPISGERPVILDFKMILDNTTDTEWFYSCVLLRDKTRPK